jgi:hypothetical protein
MSTVDNGEAEKRNFSSGVEFSADADFCAFEFARPFFGGCGIFRSGGLSE